MNMGKEALKTWRRHQGLAQRQLAEMLGVSTMAVAYWEWGKRSIPALLPLAMEALENRFKEGRINGVHK